MNTLDADRGALKGLWVFDETVPPSTEPFPSQRLIESKSGVFYIAAFQPGRLMVFDPSAQTYRPAKAKLILALDSNLCSLLRQVLVNGSTDEERFRQVIDLAKHNRIWRAEAQPMPYLRELVLRQEVSSTRADAEQAVLAILKLQALDPEGSESAGKLIYDEAVLVAIDKTFGVKTYEECAVIIVQEMIDKGQPDLDHDHIAIYGALLKMIDVGLVKKTRPLDEKLAEIDAFISSVLLAVQPRLFVLARLFFIGTLAKLLKISAGDATFNRNHLIGSSYDLHLATIHEKFLGDSELPDGWLSILCTLDRGLADYAGRFPTKSLAAMRDSSFRLAHIWDDDWLKAALGPAQHDEVIRAIDARMPSPITNRLSTDMIGAIRELEGRLGVTTVQSLLGDATPKKSSAGSA